MEWYGPLTVMPAIGLLILSTSNFIISLNNEITELSNHKERCSLIIVLKVDQLKKLGIANASLYASSLLFLISGLSKAIAPGNTLSFYVMVGGVVGTTVALIFLFIHSLKSIQIRQEHLKI